MIAIVGMMEGSVTCSSCLNRLAPSMPAASYSAGSIADNADRKMIEFHPMFFHTSEMTYSGLNHSALAMK